MIITCKKCGFRADVSGHPDVPTYRHVCRQDAKKECPHLGDQLDEDAPRDTRRGCRGNTHTSVWECDVYGKCTPFSFAKDMVTYHACRGCSRSPQ